MSEKHIDLNALMFSANFDEYLEEPPCPAEKAFRFSFWSFLSGILLGAAIGGIAITSKIHISANSIQIEPSNLAVMCASFSLEVGIFVLSI